MLTAYVQSFDVADRIMVRHAMTFLVGLAGVAALLPIGRLVVGRWAGLTAIALCLLTGYLYGSLFFTPIDVPFLAAMTWARTVAGTLEPVAFVWRCPVHEPKKVFEISRKRAASAAWRAVLHAKLLVCAAIT